jgi:hypothetical protein
MQRESFKEELAVRYLLGDLTDDEQVEVEDRAFADHQYMERMLAVEDDLIDNYLRGSLSERERSQFEKRFLASDHRRQKIEFARALAEVSSRRAAPADQEAPFWESLLGFLRSLSPGLKFSLATASLVAIIGAAWLIGQKITLRREVKPFQAEKRDTQTRQETPKEVVAQREPERPAPSQPARPTMASIMLLPGISRSAAERPRLAVPQTAQLIRLQVVLECTDDYRSFKVELRNPQGQEAWTKDRLHAQQSRAGRVINLVIPRSVFRSGQYELALKGSVDNQATEDLRYYYFDVRKQ